MQSRGVATRAAARTVATGFSSTTVKAAVGVAALTSATVLTMNQVKAAAIPPEGVAGTDQERTFIGMYLSIILSGV